MQDYGLQVEGTFESLQVFEARSNAPSLFSPIETFCNLSAAIAWHDESKEASMTFTGTQ